MLVGIFGRTGVVGWITGAPGPDAVFATLVDCTLVFVGTDGFASVDATEPAVLDVIGAGALVWTCVAADDGKTLTLLVLPDGPAITATVCAGVVFGF